MYDFNDAASDSPSLLDKLIDNNLDFQDDDGSGKDLYFGWNRYCQSLKRDLEMLFASRPLSLITGDVFFGVTSIIAYGLPRSTNNPQREILDAVRRFEPRFIDVTLISQDEKNTSNTYSLNVSVKWNGDVKRMVVNIYEENSGYVVDICE